MKLVFWLIVGFSLVLLFAGGLILNSDAAEDPGSPSAPTLGSFGIIAQTAGATILGIVVLLAVWVGPAVARFHAARRFSADPVWLVQRGIGVDAGLEVLTGRTTDSPFFPLLHARRAGLEITSVRGQLVMSVPWPRVLIGVGTTRRPRTVPALLIEVDRGSDGHAVLDLAVSRDGWELWPIMDAKPVEEVAQRLREIQREVASK